MRELIFRGLNRRHMEAAAFRAMAVPVWVNRECSQRVAKSLLALRCGVLLFPAFWLLPVSALGSDINPAARIVAVTGMFSRQVAWIDPPYLSKHCNDGIYEDGTYDEVRPPCVHPGSTSSQTTTLTYRGTTYLQRDSMATSDWTASLFKNGQASFMIGGGTVSQSGHKTLRSRYRNGWGETYDEWTASDKAVQMEVARVLGYGQLTLPSYDVFTTKHSYSSTQAVTFACDDPRPITALRLTGQVHKDSVSDDDFASFLLNDTRPIRGDFGIIARIDTPDDSYAFGVTPQPLWMYSGYNVEWEVPFSGKCGDTVSITGSASSRTGNATFHGTIHTITPVFSACDVKASIHGSDTVLDPASGGSIGITGTIYNSSDQPIHRTLNILDKAFTGTGSQVNVTWDGRYADGTVVEPGSYSATLTAKTADGKCGDTKTINFTVTPAPEDQCLYVDFGSQAHMASGNLSLSQELFSASNGALPAAVILHYNSLSPHSGSLGRGWSHNYDVSLKEKSDGAVLIHEGDWKYQYFTLSNGAYAGQVGNYSTLTKSADGAFTLTRKDGNVYTFGTDGKLTSVADRNGNTQLFTYSSGNLSTVTVVSGRAIRFAYDDTNHLTSVTDPGGKMYILSVGAALNSITQPDSGVWHYTYDSKSYLLSKKDPLGNETTYAYDDKHRVVTAIDPEGKVRSIAYPTSAATVTSTTFTEKDDGQWEYVYDTRSGKLHSKKDPQGGVLSYTYDNAGNRTSTTLPDGTTTTFTYDGWGNLLSTTDSLDQTTSYTYNAFGQITSSLDPQGNTSKYSYDAHGNLTSTTDPTGSTTEYQYDSRGYVIKTTNALGEATYFTYDAASNLTTLTAPTGATTTYTYDGAANVTSQTDPNGAVTRFGYDSRNRLVAVTDPAGNTTTYAYDLNGNRTSTTDANGKTTRNTFNSRGQLIKTIDALGNATTYAYGGTGCASCGGGAGKLTSLTDANGNSTTYQYDSLGRMMSEIDALGNRTVYGYDSNGNMVAKTDANGATTRFEYDGAGRILKKTYHDDTATTFTYDANGNILTAANADAAYAFTYDAAGRVLAMTDATGKTIQYSYDRAGRKAKTFYPDGAVVSTTYDTAGRLSTITNGQGRTYFYTYDTNGRRGSLSFPNGTKAVYAYDAAGHLTKIAHKTSSGSTIASFGYTLDKTGNRLSKSTLQTTVFYEYDAIYRLTQALSSTPGHSSNSAGRGNGIPNATQQQKEFYVYDPVGNTLSSDRIAAYAYNESNQLISNGGTYVYDRNGNLTKKITSNGTTLYTWDYENRLTKVVAPDGAVTEFRYDPFSRRVAKRVTQEGATMSTGYFYDEQNLILEYDRSGNVVNKFVHGPGTDEPVAVTSGKDTYFYHADGLGSVVALTDMSGKIVQTYDYDSFGNLKDQSNRIKQGFTYTGREWDKNAGLYYYRARYYDPILGRFISKDPISFKGGINLYLYVANNPTNLTDPSGLVPGDKFETVELAVTNAIMFATPLSDAANVEYGGWILKTNDCKFTYHWPIKGLLRSIPEFPIDKPANAADAWYHTHRPVAWWDELFADANPREASPMDKQISNRNNSVAYIGFGGHIYIYYPR